MIKLSFLSAILIFLGSLALADEDVASLSCLDTEGTETAVLQVDLHHRHMHLKGSSPAVITVEDPVFLMSQLSDGLLSITYLFNQVTGDLVLSGLIPSCFVPHDGRSCAINSIRSRWRCNTLPLR